MLPPFKRKLCLRSGGGIIGLLPKKEVVGGEEMW